MGACVRGATYDQVQIITNVLMEARYRILNNRVSIIPLERRLGTYDRLLAAPMSLLTLLLGKTAVGA